MFVKGKCVYLAQNTFKKVVQTTAPKIIYTFCKKYFDIFCHFKKKQ